MATTNFQKSCINNIKRNLSLRGCPLTVFQKPFRRIVFNTNERFEKTSCILSSPLVFVQNCVTISCPGGSISTMCCDSIFKELLSRKVRQVVIMAGTNNLYDNSKRLIVQQQSDGMYYLVQKLKFHSIKVEIRKLIDRKGKTETVRRLNNCYRDVARELNVPFVNLKKFKSGKHLCNDGLDPKPSNIREPASGFRRAIKQTELFLFKETLMCTVSVEAILNPIFFYLNELIDLQQSTRLELKIDKSRAYSGRILLEKMPLGLKIFYRFQYFIWMNQWICSKVLG